MSVYKYFCKNCKEKFEIEASLQEKESCCSPKFVCPKCGSKDIKQKFSLSAFFEKKDKCQCSCEGDCK